MWLGRQTASKEVALGAGCAQGPQGCPDRKDPGRAELAWGGGAPVASHPSRSIWGFLLSPLSICDIRAKDTLGAPPGSQAALGSEGLSAARATSHPAPGSYI